MFFGNQYASLYGPYATPLDAWPSLRFTNTSPPQSWTEPVTYAQAEQFLRVEYGYSVDQNQRDEITLMIMAARAAAELIQNKDLVRKQYDMAMDYWPYGRKIALRDPLVSVDLLQYKDINGNVTTMAENVDFFKDTMKSEPIVMPLSTKTWPAFYPWPSSAILLRFTSGYLPTDIYWQAGSGAMVHRGMLQLISHWFDNRVPWTRGIGDIQEYPFTVSQCLSAGATERHF